MEQACKAKVLQCLPWVARLEQLVRAGVANTHHGASEHVHKAFSLVISAPTLMACDIEDGAVWSERLSHHRDRRLCDAGECADPGESDHAFHDYVPGVVERLVGVARDLERFDVEFMERAATARATAREGESTGQAPALMAWMSCLDGGVKTSGSVSNSGRSGSKAYVAGVTTYELAERFGVHRTTVARIVRATGHKVGRTGLLPMNCPR